MGVIHYKQDKKSLAIYAPPKCGTTLLDQLTTFPEYEGKFFVDNACNFEKRDIKLFVVRDHHSRVLSTYFDKLVINDTSQWANHSGWRAQGFSEPPAERYGPKHAWINFRSYTQQLGLYQWWDNHLTSYLQIPYFSFALRSVLERKEGIAMWASTKQIVDGALIQTANDYLGLPPQYGWDAMQDVLMQTSKHKVHYSNSLPPPQHYQQSAKRWSDVSRDNLYRCYLETGHVPAPELMYEDPQVVLAISNQMAYRKDDYEISRAGGPRVCLTPEEAIKKYTAIREQNESR